MTAGAVTADRKATTFGSSPGKIARAWSDIIEGVSLWQLWGTLGWNDILQRYRRSMLGPFWLTLSMAIMVITLGILYGTLFATPIRDFIPFLCAGLLVWTFISSALNEAGSLFFGADSYIKQVRLPYTVYLFRFTWSRIIIFLHNLVVYVGVAVYFELWPGVVGLLAIVSFAIVVANTALATLLIGLVSARFRDIPQIVTSLVQIAFFLTPVMWNPQLLGPHSYVVYLNPFYYFIEIVREPLLGHLPQWQLAAGTALITAVNLAITAIFFARFRARIAYWV